MIVDPDFMDHWRTGMVADAIQDPLAPVYILRLWAHCQERKSDTFVMPTRGLKAQCKAPCDAEVFERALIDAGFIERNGDTVTVCGWAEKNAALLAAWENGSKGGRPRKQKTETEPTGNPRETQAEPNANQDITHAEPIREEKRREEKKEPKGSSSARPTIPCPYQAIVDLYHQHLPELPRVKLMPAARQKVMRDRWAWVLRSTKSDGTRRAETAEQALLWLGEFFARASKNEFLTGKVAPGAGHGNWRCDIDYLLTDKGMKQVIEKTQEAA